MIEYEIVGYNNKVDLNTVKMPLYVYIELTDNCNLKCKFCSVNNKYTNFISIESIKKILNEMSKLNIMDVYYTGGEPLLHPEFDAIVEYGYKLGIRQTVLTNGVLINKHINILNKIMYLCVSLHGSEITHNKLVGSNCFSKVLNNIDIAKKYTNVKINYTVFNENQDLNEMLFVLNICKNKNITVSFSKYNNIGAGKKNNCSIDIKKFVENLDIISNKNYHFTVNDCVAPCLVNEKFLYLTHGCGAGYLFASIDYDGNVKICPSSSYVLGNINEKSFSKIWDSKEMQNYRNFEWIPLYCKSCKNLSRCRCGCKAENESKLIIFNDYQVKIHKEKIWNDICSKTFSVNVSILRREQDYYVSLSNPPRKYNKKALDIIEKLNSGITPSELIEGKDLIMAMYRDKILKEVKKCYEEN